MKKLLLFTFLSIFSCLSISAQEEYYKFLFEKFDNGKIVNNDSSSREARLNYETITEKMYFLLQDSTLWELAQPEKVALIYLQNRVFEHVGKGVFYERIKTGNDFMYARWRSKVQSTGKKGAYGMTSNTGSIDNVSHTTMGRGSIHQLKINEDFKTTSHNLYYLKNKNKFSYFDSFNSLAKKFKGHESAIKAYIKAENLNFKEQKDVEKAVTYAYSLTEY